MAWQVALIVDTKYSPRELSFLVHQMPVWAVRTAEREAAAPSIYDGAGQLWSPEPAFTLFDAAGASDGEQTCLHLVSTMLEHHPLLACLELIGVPNSERLTAILLGEGFVPATGHIGEGTRFRKPIEDFSNIRELVLDANGWSTSDDVYESFFEAVGAPAWHGKNFDALNDSIRNGGINEIEVPYRMTIRNFGGIRDGARETTARFIDLIHRFESQGCPVAVRIE